MGGLGSGRRTGSVRGTVDAHLELDVNHLHRKNVLQSGWAGDLHWVRKGGKIGAMKVRAEADQLHLSYQIQIKGGPQDVNESVRIVRTACRLGGTRPYLICPGAEKETHCGRRVCKLYLAGRYFLCRHCYGLAYASQRDGPQDRRLRRAHKLRQRVGGNSYRK